MSEDKRFCVALKGAIFNGDKFLIVKQIEIWDKEYIKRILKESR